jgi:biotin carboxyl carrier protein
MRPAPVRGETNGREYEVSVLELAPGENAPAPAAAVGVAGMAAPGAAPATVTAAHAAPAAPGAAGDVVAGMGGVVVEVHVNVGQTVAPGDRLLVLEAMKMKSPVIATRAGQVTRVLVAPRDAVEGGQVLVTIA